jgi:hypothetical protein
MITQTALKSNGGLHMRTFFGSQRAWGALLAGGTLAMFLMLALRGGTQPSARADDDRDGSDESKIRRGLEIAPVELNLRRKNRALVGLGSYIVNAQAGCNDCHTQPQFAPGGNPHLGQPE